ncbi:putative short-chain dehydrogenase reductase SDR [Rosellinia necatrix]|uniref:Putative short-chain dehydrogenase reductase SDR n=1 Tax=Rosellinia necatrix TaxID=77044 RepID=A0A1W2TTS4_ROSNE|nr:putative short-chain dehydrogenase reductase SDR [Rosellinia necatrix]
MTAGKQRTVLITGCSDGGIGAALAEAFDEAGYRVYATARDPGRMAGLRARRPGIEALALDTLSAASIAACVERGPAALDVLVNNAGRTSLMPVADADLAEARRVFDLNVWSHVAVTQAFLPRLLLAASSSSSSSGSGGGSGGPIIVNNTSVAAALPLPFQGVYCASKAALSALSATLRLELAPFGVRVVELRTGVVKSNLIRSMQAAGSSSGSGSDSAASTTLPEGSIYDPARDRVEAALRQEQFADAGMPAAEWAEAVVRDLSGRSPAPLIWRGESAFLCWVLSLLPRGWSDGVVRKASGLAEVAQLLRK